MRGVAGRLGRPSGNLDLFNIRAAPFPGVFEGRSTWPKANVVSLPSVNRMSGRRESTRRRCGMPTWAISARSSGSSSLGNMNIAAQPSSAKRSCRSPEAARWYRVAGQPRAPSNWYSGWVRTRKPWEKIYARLPVERKVRRTRRRSLSSSQRQSGLWNDYRMAARRPRCPE